MKTRSTLVTAALLAALAVPVGGKQPGQRLARPRAVRKAPRRSRTSPGWFHPAFPWYEPPASGPGPIRNLSRWAEQRPSGACAVRRDCPDQRTG